MSTLSEPLLAIKDAVEKFENEFNFYSVRS